MHDLHQLEDRLADFGAQVTYNITEAKLVIGKVATKRRTVVELRSRRLHTDDVTPETAEPPAKRQKTDVTDDTEVIEISDDSTTDDEGGEVKETAALSVDNLQGDTVKVIRMEWLDDSLKAGKLLPLRQYLVYEGKPIKEPLNSPNAPTSSQRIPSPLYHKSSSMTPASNPLNRGQSILERAKADVYPNTASSQTSLATTTINRGYRQFGDRTFASSDQSSQFSHHSTSKAALLQQTTSDYEGEPSSDIPPPPDWVTQGIKYACQRSTPANPPNTPFIAQLKSIRLARILTGDEVGVRAYSTAIAAIAAYPYRITHPKEILQLPGCDAKIANLWIEWKNNGETTVAAAADAEQDETLRILRTFYDIWGVGATTAREFHLDRGWRDLDDVIEHGWHSLTRVQQIGLKYYDEFKAGIPRLEVERIAAVIHTHANHLLRDHPGGPVELALVGGYRRGKPFPGDVDLILSHRALAATANLVDALVRSLERAGCITHTLLLSLHNTARGQSVLPYRAASTMIGPKSVGFDTLDKALVVWQDPDWPTRDADLAADPKAKNPNPHRRVDIIVSPWRSVGCAVAGWSGGTTFERDLRRYARNVKGWKFDSSGVRDRRTGEVVLLEGEEGVGEGEGWVEAEKRVFEGMGLVWREPVERCTE